MGLRELILPILVLLKASEAYPDLWSGCGHPDEQILPHGKVDHRSDIEFTLMLGDSEGEPVTEYEPGEEYTLKVKPYRRSMGVLTASSGDLDGMGSDTSHNWPTSCTQGSGDLRADFGRRSIFYVKWRAPLETDPESTRTVEFKATFSESSVGDFKYNSMLVHPVKGKNQLAAQLPPGNSKFATCVELEGRTVCDTVCDEVKVTQEPNGKLRMRCFEPSVDG